MPFNLRHSGAGGGWAGQANITRSAYFDGSADELKFTPGSAGDNANFIVGAWCRRTTHGSQQAIMIGDAGSNDAFEVYFESDDTLRCINVVSASVQWELRTSRVFRDTEWVHVVLSFDSSDATANDRVRLWINGVEETNFGTRTNPSLNYAANYWNTTDEHIVGSAETTYFFNGSLTQVFNIDGQTIQAGDHTIEDFGEFVTVGSNGLVWAPASDATIKTHVDAGDSNTSWLLSSDIGDGTDDSTHGNDFTPTSMSDAANGTNDTPSDPLQLWSTLSASGGFGVGSGGFVSTASGGSATVTAHGTLCANTGKFHVEFEMTGTFASGNGAAVGLCGRPDRRDTVNHASSQMYQLVYDSSGLVYDGTDGSVTSAATYNTWTTGDRITMEVDFDAGNVEWFKNGSSEGTIAIDGDFSERMWTIMHGDRTSSSVTQIATLNVHEDDFVDTPTSGFNSWKVSNMTAPDYQGVDVFNVIASEDLSSPPASVTAAGFQPDVLIAKQQNGTAEWALIDSSRGVTQGLVPSDTGSEDTHSDLASFDSDGYTTDSTVTTYSSLSASEVLSYLWKVNGGTTEANSDGDITTTVQVAPEGHMSIIQWTGNATANQTLGHGLGKVPSMFIAKNRDDAAANWPVWFKDFGAEYLLLNSNAAVGVGSTFFDTDCEAADTFEIQAHDSINASGEDLIALCFADTPGVLITGQYIGNGSGAGPQVYTGFRPRFLMVKRKDSSGGWRHWDSARDDAGNPRDDYMTANNNAAEVTDSALDFDFLANGFKLRGTHADINASGGTYHYLAMADVGHGAGLPPIPGE